MGKGGAEGAWVKYVGGLGGAKREYIVLCPEGPKGGIVIQSEHVSRVPTNLMRCPPASTNHKPQTNFMRCHPALNQPPNTNHHFPVMDQQQHLASTPFSYSCMLPPPPPPPHKLPPPPHTHTFL